MESEVFGKNNGGNMKRHKLYRPRAERTPEEKAYIKRETIRDVLSTLIVIILAIIFLAILINVVQGFGHA